MSARKRAVDLTEDAQRDFRDILVYGEQQWGTAQRDRYEARLNRGLQSLARHPYLGRARNEIAAGVRSLVIQRHIILYRIEDDAIRVLRIVHASMDLRALTLDE
jgi:toxin ParE1/3/4